MNLIELGLHNYTHKTWFKLYTPSPFKTRKLLNPVYARINHVATECTAI